LVQVALYPGTYFYYRWRNNTRAKVWDKMTEQQKKEYIDTTTDVENKRWVVSAMLVVTADLRLLLDLTSALRFDA
jgi:cell division protein YceG involved in septum cleavage